MMPLIIGLIKNLKICMLTIFDYRDMDRAIETALREVFGHNNFKSHEQKKAITSMVAGNTDLLVIMPTGSGLNVMELSLINY